MALIPFVFSSWIINDITYLFTPGLIIYSSRSQLLESQIPYLIYKKMTNTITMLMLGELQSKYKYSLFQRYNCSLVKHN